MPTLFFNSTASSRFYATLRYGTLPLRVLAATVCSVSWDFWSTCWRRRRDRTAKRPTSSRRWGRFQQVRSLPCIIHANCSSCVTESPGGTSWQHIIDADHAERQQISIRPIRFRYEESSSVALRPSQYYKSWFALANKADDGYENFVYDPMCPLQR